MNKLLIFILRVILAMAFSVILIRLFHPEKSIIFIAGTGTLLVSMAYVVEYFKNRDADNHGDTPS